MICAGLIKTPKGEDIRLFTSSRSHSIDRVFEIIRQMLPDHEEILLIRLITGQAVRIDYDPDYLQTQTQFCERFISSICEELNLNVSEYKGKSRRHKYRDVRLCVYQILRDNTNLSLKAIGEIHNGRDHSTILNGLRKFADLHPHDYDIQRTYQICINTLEQNFSHLNDHK